MPLKAMIFIDGSWFYHSRQILFDIKDESGFEIDYKRIPTMISDSISEQLNTEVVVVRTCYFGTLPVNKPGYNPAKQRAFYTFLAAECGFDVEIIEIDYRQEQSTGDDRSVGVALAASMAHFAALPGVFDIGVLVSGNADYKPLVKRIRGQGKQTRLVAINNGENRNITNPGLLTEPMLFDAPPIFLDDHIDQIRLVRKEQTRECKACGETEVTTWAGVEFYCSKCRTDHRRRLRTCDTCGREEETVWDKDYFYCSQCRKNFKKNGGRSAEETTQAPGA